MAESVVTVPGYGTHCGYATYPSYPSCTTTPRDLAGARDNFATTLLGQPAVQYCVYIASRARARARARIRSYYPDLVAGKVAVFCILRIILYYVFVFVLCIVLPWVPTPQAQLHLYCTVLYSR